MKHLGIRTVVVIVAMAAATFALNDYSTGGHNGIVRNQSADLLGQGGVRLGANIHYAQDAEYIHSVRENGLLLTLDGSPKFFSGDIYAGFGIASIFDLGINLPIYYDRPNFGSMNDKGVGDLEVSAKLAGFVLKGDDKAFTTAYFLGVQFPTGNSEDGFFPRHAYYENDGIWSANKVFFLPRLLGTLHFDRLGAGIPIRLNLNLGGVFNFPNETKAITSSVGFEVDANDYLSLFIEATGEGNYHTLSWDDKSGSFLKNPIYITPGLKLNVPDAGLTFLLAGDLGISGYALKNATTTTTARDEVIVHQANPLYNVFFGMSWAKPSKPRDRDKDGIPDAQDKCPNVAGIPENQGCPDVDSDKDGIVDRLDKCPNEAGVKENNGCP
jgi:hypothetical protein